jgi:hypothetical protein
VDELMALMQHNATNKRRLMATDVRNDALGRMGTIRTLIELRFGRRAGALVCHRWRDASRGLALTKGEEGSLVRAVAADLANLRYYDVTRMDLTRGYDGTDPAAQRRRHLIMTTSMASRTAEAAASLWRCAWALTNAMLREAGLRMGPRIRIRVRAEEVMATVMMTLLITFRSEASRIIPDAGGGGGLPGDGIIYFEANRRGPRNWMRV